MRFSSPLVVVPWKGLGVAAGKIIRLGLSSGSEAVEYCQKGRGYEYVVQSRKEWNERSEARRASDDNETWSCEAVT